jgi:hypothetical protein
MAVSGVRLAGRTIMAQPAASAAPALRVIMAMGKFQGVMHADRPTGSRVTWAWDIWRGIQIMLDKIQIP